MNAMIRSDQAALDPWTALHGDDEDTYETGYHLIQNDGANIDFLGQNLVNTVADGIYHMCFEICDGRFLNEDGDLNQTLEDVATWLNFFYNDATRRRGRLGRRYADRRRAYASRSTPAAATTSWPAAPATTSSTVVGATTPSTAATATT